jgi:TolB-like protein/Tfp pilus assembly protein PilF
MSTSGDTRANADVRADEVRAYVGQLLASPVFSGSARRAQLLHYLVERSLAGEGDRVNEYAIGVDVFGKPDSFDPRTESTVRTEFSRLRQKIKEYYKADGSTDRVRIDFLPRSYVPVFTFPDAEAPEETAVRRRFPGRWLLAAAAALVVAAASIAAFRFLRPGGEPIHSIVVLPFVNLSPDHHDDYLADGITEELTNQLAQSKNLRVVARTSASLFRGKAADIREVGRQLNVDTAIEGSLERVGDRIRITAQMNRTSDGYHVWSNSFETSADDVLAVQQQISRSIAAAVAGLGRRSADTSLADSTQDPQAHDLYLRARHELALSTPDSYRQALVLLDRATAKDPDYVNAWIAIAVTHWQLWHLSIAPPEQEVPLVRAALEKALALDPSCGEARGLLANIIASCDRDWPRAEQEFRRAIADGAQAPTRAFYGMLLAAHGRFREGQEQLRLAEDLDPLGGSPRFDQFLAFYLEHNYNEAKRVLHGILELYPDRFDARYMLGATAMVERDCAEVNKEFTWCARQFPAPTTKIGLALASACVGDQAKARAYLAQAEEPDAAGYASPYQLAVGYEAIGDKQAALALLEKSAQLNEQQILYLKYDQLFDSLRTEPRYIALEKRVGLEP